MRKLSRNRLLVFSRKSCQVMLRFEIRIYGNPHQDLNRLWWDLVEKYQEVKRPEGRNMPDYATKIHIVTSPSPAALIPSQKFRSFLAEKEIGHASPTTRRTARRVPLRLRDARHVHARQWLRILRKSSVRPNHQNVPQFVRIARPNFLNSRIVSARRFCPFAIRRASQWMRYA